MGDLPGRTGSGPHGRVRRAQGRAGVGQGPGGVPGGTAAADRDPGRHRARLGGAAAQPGRHRAEPVRPAQPVPGERRGGAAPVGDGLPAARLLRPRGPGGGRGTAAPQLGQPRLAAHPGRLQRGDPGLAVVLHVHLLHRPGRQVPARHAEGKRLRSAQPHLRVHAQGGGAPHDGGHHRRGPGGAAHRRGDALPRHRRRGRPGCDPAAGHPEVPELPLLGVARPVRRRDLHQRGELLHRRAQGPLARGPPQGRPQARQRRDHGGRAVRRRRDRADRGLGAGRPQHRPAARVHLGLPGRRQAVEPHPGGGRRQAAAEAAARRLQPQGGRVRRDRGHPGRREDPGGGVGAPPGPVAAYRRGQDLRPVADAAGAPAGQDCRMDRTAAQRHQRPAVRLRLRAPRVGGLQ